MKKRVILSVMPESFEQKMLVTLRVANSTLKESDTQFSGYLPPAPKLLQSLKQWQSAYHQMVKSKARGVKLKPVEVIHSSCFNLSNKLVAELNSWLNSGYEEWQKLRVRLQQNVTETNEILFIVLTNNPLIRQLPWHQWNFFKLYPKAEVVLSMPDYQPSQGTRVSATNTVKILAILGDSMGIDVQQDRSFLEGLPGADIKFLVKPQRQELNEELWTQGWDILFFAGHSSSIADGNSGRIYINQTDSLTINDLDYALRTAVKNGLQLAIFNSCDGLGIGRDLSNLNIPQMIVMREPVPDKVAQEFLKSFLSVFAGGESFYLAVRKARERLQGWEDEFPCASWLPVICQNPAEFALTWRELRNRKHHLFALLSRYSLLSVLLFSALTTAFISGTRWLGILQPMELKAFDQLVQWRPEEKADPRLVLITVTENDLNLPQQQDRKGSLSDTALVQVLQKLKQYKPRVIGLDIYRDFPAKPEIKQLATWMRQNESLIAICKISDISLNEAGIAPPPEIPTERLGFSDFVTDPDGVLRRQLLETGIEAKSPCTAPYAFSLQVAFRYLAAQGILPKYTPEDDLQFNEVVLKGLPPRFAGYQKTKILAYQVLLNYRSPSEPEKIAEQVTLTEILNGQVNPNTFKDKIVLIGTTASSFQDLWLTPYSSRYAFGKLIPGVTVQAQMVSQILSAVLDKRPMIWAFPAWGEIVWVFVFSTVGGTIASKLKSPVYIGLGLAVALFSLYILSFGLLLQNGCWVPLIPSVLGLSISGCIAICIKPQH